MVRNVASFAVRLLSAARRCARRRAAAPMSLALLAGLALGAANGAQAGVFGRLKEAVQQKTQHIKEAAPQIGGQTAAAAPDAAATNGEDPDHPLHLTGEGHCHGHNSATCLDYMEVAAQCTAPLHGYRAKLLAERIDKRLGKDRSLSAGQRENLREDLAAFTELAAKKSDDDPTLGGEAHSQRYLSDIADEDQVWVNAENARFRNRIMNKCEGADHMGVGHRTELIKDFGPTGDEAVAQYRKTHPQRPQRSAMNQCTQAIGGLRFKVMADMMEKKMTGLSLSAKERAEWEADIAATRNAAAAGGTALPTVADPANPYRPITRLTSPQEQMALANETLKETQAALAACKKRAGA